MRDGGGRVVLLVVDDDRNICSAIRRALQSSGYRVAIAYDAASAMLAAEAKRPQAALVDLCLRDKIGRDRSGFELIEKLSALDLRMDIGLHTGFADADVHARALEMGIRVFEKPMPIPAIVAWMDHVELTQPDGGSDRWEGVRRRVLYVAATCCPSFPNDVHLTVAHNIDDAYRGLRNDHDVVVVDGGHHAMDLLVSIATELGRSVYALTTDAEARKRAEAAGAVGVLAPNDLHTIGTMPIREPSWRIPISEPLRAKLLDVATTPMPHDERMQRLERLLLEDKLTRRGSERVAAVSAGMARATFIRRLTDNDDD